MNSYGIMAATVTFRLEPQTYGFGEFRMSEASIGLFAFVIALALIREVRR